MSNPKKNNLDWLFNKPKPNTKKSNGNNGNLTKIYAAYNAPQPNLEMRNLSTPTFDPNFDPFKNLKSFANVKATNSGDQFKYYKPNEASIYGKTKAMNYTTKDIESLEKNEASYNKMLKQLKKLSIIGVEELNEILQKIKEFKFNHSITS
jgi:hypothetical protein